MIFTIILEVNFRNIEFINNTKDITARKYERKRIFNAINQLKFGNIFVISISPK